MKKFIKKNNKYKSYNKIKSLQMKCYFLFAMIFLFTAFMQDINNVFAAEKINMGGKQTVSGSVINKDNMDVNGAYAGTDKTTLINGKITATVKQSGSEIAEGDKIDASKPINLTINFNFPVISDDDVDPDDTDTFIKGQDWVTVNLPDSLELVSSSLDESRLMFNGAHVGTLNVVIENGIKKIKITFTSEIDNTIFNAKARFEMELKANGTNDGEDDKEEEITIYDKTYVLLTPAVKTEISAEKNGSAKVNDKKIEWSIKVTAAKGEREGSLRGYYVSDNLSNVGSLVNGSFMVGTQADKSDAITATPTYDNTTGLLTYNFADADKGTKYVFYETIIPDNVYTQDNPSVKNKVEIKKGTEIIEIAEKTVTFKINWISKDGVLVQTDGGMNGGVYDPSKNQIKWSIYVEGSISNAYVTDDIKFQNSGALKVESVTVNKFKETSNDYTDSISFSDNITDVNNNNAELKVELGNINGKYRIDIVTSIDINKLNIGNKEVTINNNAKIFGDEIPGGKQSNTKGVKIGVPTVVKTKGGVDYTNNKLKWKINLNTKGQAIGNNLRILDMMVYGNDVNIINSYTGSETGTAGNLNHVSAEDIVKLKSAKCIRNNQRIDKNNLPNVPGLTFTVHTLTKDGYPIADVLVVTGADENTGIVCSGTNSYEFSYNTIITNPSYYATNDEGTFYNSASLFDGNAEINSSTANQKFNGNMFVKNMLTRTNAKIVDNTAEHNDSTVINALKSGNAGDNTDQGFDYVDKDIIYRIYVNPMSINIPEGNTDKGGTLGSGYIYTLKDTLPAGWEFKQIGGSDFLLYGGIKNSSNTNIDANTYIQDTSSILDVTASGIEMTFGFKNLNSPYVIVLKAGPTEETLKDYFKENKTHTAANKISLVNSDIITNNRDKESKAKIESNIIKKSVDESKADSKGYLVWTIDYKPSQLEVNNAALYDMIPEGIDLRIDSKGKLALTEKDGSKNITASELILGADGNYTVVSEIDIAETEIVTYNYLERKLTFSPPDYKKAYRFTYITDIMGETGTLLTNHVSLGTTGSSSTSDSDNYSVSNAAYKASFERAGSFKIVKADGSDATPLGGVEFTLYTEDGTTAIKKGTTSASGVLFIKQIPDGNYIMKETAVPAGYEISDVVYKVSVTDAKIKIDGLDRNINTNPLEIKNFKTGTVGSLSVTKTITGSGKETDKEFEFTIELKNKAGADLTASYPYMVKNASGLVSTGSLTSGGKIAVKGGETFAVSNIEKETVFTITEKDYSADGYKVSIDNGADTSITVDTAKISASGEIEADKVKNVYYTNTRNVEGLNISKTILGSGADSNKEFTFHVTLSSKLSFNYYDEAGNLAGTITNGAGDIKLKGGESITIKGLPEGTNYKVEEDDYSSEGYTTTKTGGEGTIPAIGGLSAVFTNSKFEGSLVLKKTVQGSAVDKADQFEFTVIFNDNADKNKEYNYKGNGGIADGSLKSGDTIFLSDGQSISFASLPAGTKYKITEKDYQSEGYTTVKSNESGTIVDGVTSTAAFVNTKNVGNLTIGKTVAGNGGDKEKEFEFSITLEGIGKNKEYSYNGIGVSSGTIKSGDTILLSDGQSITIQNIFEGTKYTVAEKDYSNEGYVTAREGNVGTIASNQTHTAFFTNTRNIGNLTVSKTVDGNAGDKEKKFEFTITFPNDNERSYFYTGNGLKDGRIKSGDSISLSDGQSITVNGIPEGIQYTVTEKDYSNEGYVTTKTGDSGVIETGVTAKAAFINKKNIGTLSISKTVDGNSGDRNKKFLFAVTFSNEEDSYSYIGTGVENGTIKSQDTIALADNQSIMITGINDGVEYTVTENNYSSEGYVTKATGEKGKIVHDKASVAHFVNTKQINHPESKDDEETTSPDPENTSKIPEYEKGNVPDPNSKNSPDIIKLVDEKGNVVGIYTRIQNEDGTYSYVDENGVVLSMSDIAKTGDNMPLIPIILVILLAMAGIAVLVFYKKKTFGYYYDD